MWNEMVLILSVVSVVLSTVLALLIYFSNRKSLINIVMASVILCGVGWATTIYLTVLTGNFTVAKTPFIFGTTFPAMFVIFLRMFSNMPTKKRFYYKLFIPAAVITVLTMWDKLAFSDVIIKNGYITTSKPGPMMIVSQVYQIVYLMIIFYTFVKASRLLTKGVKNIQLKYIFAGYLTCYMGSVLITSILPLFGIFRFDNLGPVFLIFLSGSMTYVATKHHLIEARVVLSEVWALLLFLAVFSAFWLNRNPINLIILFFSLIAGILLVRSVLSESKKSQEAIKHSILLAKAKRDLENLDRMKSEFVRITARELNMPISAIQRILTVLVKSKSPVSNKELTHVLEAADRLQTLSHDLSEVFLLEHGGIWLQRKKVDIDSIIERAVEDNRHQAQANDLELSYSPNPSLPHLLIDPDKIYRVIHHLIQNAIEFTVKGGVKVAADVRGDYVAVSVSDTGIGIAKEDQGKVFIKFFQPSCNVNVEKSTRASVGLGLYLTKNIIELSGGKITLDSEKGRGTTFRILLPVNAGVYPDKAAQSKSTEPLKV